MTVELCPHMENIQMCSLEINEKTFSKKVGKVLRITSAYMIVTMIHKDQMRKRANAMA